MAQKLANMGIFQHVEDKRVFNTLIEVFAFLSELHPSQSITLSSFLTELFLYNKNKRQRTQLRQHGKDR